MRLTVSALALTFMAQGILASGAFAQESGAFVTSETGTEIALSRVQLYRAVGDRMVTGNDVIGNNLRNWQQIGIGLPREAIRVGLSNGGDEGALLDAVRQGCVEAGGSYRGCAKVRLRQDRLERGGFGVARFDAALMAALPDFAVPAPMPEPAPEPKPIIAAPQAPAKIPTSDNLKNRTAMVPAMVRPVTVEAVMEAAPAQVYATRLFLGRDSFPPEAFAAYGILAFNTRATSEDEALYIAICEAFFGTLENSADAPAAKSAQMVTVWPVDDRRNPDLIDDLNTASAGGDSCAKAVEFYDLQIAREAIGHARTAGVALSGRGPFLLAWSPAGKKGQPDAVVLAADLSDVQNAVDAKDVLRIWREDIEGDQALWQDGFSVEKTRVKLRQIVNRYGDGLLKFFGG